MARLEDFNLLAMKKKDFTPRLQSTLFSSLTGRPAAISGRPDEDTERMLKAAFGEGRRGRADTRAAAHGLGVSQRSVQRWLAGSPPSAGNRKALATRARRAATTQQGRRAALADVRGSAMARRRGTLRLTGLQGPLRKGRDYLRARTIELGFDPDQLEDLFGAYEKNGDIGVISWLEGHAAIPKEEGGYLPGWAIGDITDLNFDT